MSKVITFGDAHAHETFDRVNDFVCVCGYMPCAAMTFSAHVLGKWVNAAPPARREHVDLTHAYKILVSSTELSLSASVHKLLKKVFDPIDSANMKVIIE